MNREPYSIFLTDSTNQNREWKRKPSLVSLNSRANISVACDNLKAKLNQPIRSWKSWPIRKSLPFITDANVLATFVRCFIANDSASFFIETYFIFSCWWIAMLVFHFISEIKFSALKYKKMKKLNEKPTKFTISRFQTCVQCCQSRHMASYSSIGNPFPASLSCFG